MRDVSIELADGAAGTVRGRVTNVRGEPLADICVVAYLAFGPVRVAATSTDGTYLVPDVGSGTWAVGYLACGEHDMELRVVDPAVPSIAYPAQWLGGEVLHVPGDGEGPDPIAQGAEMIEVRPGAPLDADFCFGCGMVDAEVTSRSGDVATFSFAAPELLDGTEAHAQGARSSRVGARADAMPLTYQASCSAQGAPTLTSAPVTSAETPLGIVGLAGGSSYDCTVTASVDGIAVASSATMTVCHRGGTGARGGRPVGRRPDAHRTGPVAHPPPWRSRVRP